MTLRILPEGQIEYENRSEFGSKFESEEEESCKPTRFMIKKASLTPVCNSMFIMNYMCALARMTRDISNVIHAIHDMPCVEDRVRVPVYIVFSDAFSSTVLIEPGWTVLMVTASCIEYVHSSIVDALMDRQCDINAVDERGRTPLMLACTRYKSVRSLYFIRRLISEGADVNASDGNGVTALHISVCRSLVITRVLLDAGSDVNCVTKIGKTVIHYLARQNCENRNSEFYEILMTVIDRGADVSTCSSSGRSGFSLMCKYNPLCLDDIMARSKYEISMDSRTAGSKRHRCPLLVRIIKHIKSLDKKILEHDQVYRYIDESTSPSPVGVRTSLFGTATSVHKDMCKMTKDYSGENLFRASLADRKNNKALIRKLEGILVSMIDRGADIMIPYCAKESCIRFYLTVRKPNKAIIELMTRKVVSKNHQRL